MRGGVKGKKGEACRCCGVEETRERGGRGGRGADRTYVELSLSPYFVLKGYSSA